jgi:hypothetical protein
MSPWLLLGFLMAGMLHVFFPDGKINNLLGKGNTRSVIRAALIGVPLPLCSCGVIPAGISLHKNGASKGASVSFLISTPQTGVDSVLVTYSMLGLPFAIIRPFVAFITGIAGGYFTHFFEKRNPHQEAKAERIASQNLKIERPIRSVFRYAFYDFMNDLAQWLIIGLLVAALIAVVIPDDFFAGYIKNELIGMMIILLVSIPFYVCATSSVPIAAVLMAKGLSPGAALVFLMAGPASNAATISVIGKSLGRRTLIVYMATLILGSLFFGLVIDYLLPRAWFSHAASMIHEGHTHELLPYWIKIASGITLTVLLTNIYLQRWINYRKKRQTLNLENQHITHMNQMKVMVKGMNCSHCKASVETNLGRLEGVEEVNADFEKDEVTITGSNVDLEKVKLTVESIGYKYMGSMN